MDRYDLIVEELQNRLDNDEIDLEFAEAVNELAYNKYVVETETNSQAHDVYSEYKKKYKEYLKEYKESIRNKDYSEAKKSLNKAIKILEDAKKEIKSIPSTDASVICSLFSSFIPELGNMILTYLASSLANIVVGIQGLPSITTAMYKVIRDCSGVVKNIKDKDIDEWTTDDFNLYKNALINKLDDLIKYVKQLDAQVERALKKQKEEDTKEKKKLK